MSFAFLTASATDAVARSPMERQARAAGARFEVRDETGATLLVLPT